MGPHGIPGGPMESHGVPLGPHGGPSRKIDFFKVLQNVYMWGPRAKVDQEVLRATGTSGDVGSVGPKHRQPTPPPRRRIAEGGAELPGRIDWKRRCLSLGVTGGRRGGAKIPPENTIS